MKPLTLQEAREKIASDNGHGSWNICVWRENLTNILLLDAEAAQLFGGSTYEAVYFGLLNF